MLVGILGDVHMGASYHFGKILDGNVNSRLLDFTKTLRFSIDTCGEKGVKIVVLTGDVFKDKKPGPIEQDAFWAELERGHDKYGIKFIIVAGNHDMPTYKRITINKIAANLNGKYVVAADDVEKISLNNDTALVLVPFHSKVTEKMPSTDDVLNLIKDKLDSVDAFNPKKKTIAIWHCISQGTYLADYTGMEVDALNEPVIPIELSSRFNISIFGHVHRFSKIIDKNNKCVYNLGSMEVNDFTDEDQDKYMMIVDTSTMRPMCIKLPVVKATKIELKVEGSITPFLEANVKTDDVKGKVIRLKLTVDNDLMQTYNEQEVRDIIEDKGAYKFMGASFVVVEDGNVVRNLDISEITNEGSVLTCMKKYLEDNSKSHIEETLSYAKEIISKVGVDIL